MNILRKFKMRYLILLSFIGVSIMVGFCENGNKDDNLIGAFINGEFSENIPLKNSGYLVEKIVCDNTDNASWDYDVWGIKLSNWSMKSKCNIYFKSGIKLGEVTTFVDTSGGCPTVNTDGSVSVTSSEKNNGYLCSAPDAYGTSYYFRGNVSNNYVKFAGFYWRIVRVNGDGTVRIIYDGTSAHTNDEATEDRQIGTSAFNENYNDNAYVGYMYGTAGSSTYSETHNNVNSSTIKSYLDTWYEENIVHKENEGYIGDNLFCNDRSLSSNTPKGYSNKGYGTEQTAYRWYNFANNINNNKMLLTCPQKNDAFTVDDTSKGNGALIYAIGLITTDEIVLAGGWSSINSNYYLYTGQHYWTMSPGNYSSGASSNHSVYSNGNAGDYYAVSGTQGVRPVLNLKADVLKYGDGTANNPYSLSVQ